MPTPHLRGRVSLDDSPFMASLRRTRVAGQRFASQMSSGLRAPVGRISAMLGGAFTARAFAGGITGAINMGGELHNLSKSTGIAVGELYALTGVFAESDKTSSDVASSISRMQKAVAGGSKNFKGLNISISALQKMGPAEQFKAIASAIIAIEDPAKRTAAAMQVFGKSGASLMPVFEDIQSVDLAKLGQTGTLMQRNAAAFDEAGDAMTRAKRASGGLFVGIASGMLTGIMAGSKALDAIDWGAKGTKIGKDISTAISAAMGVAELFDNPKAKGENVDAAKSVAAEFGDKLKESVMRDLIPLGRIAQKFLPKPLADAASKLGNTLLGSAGMAPPPAGAAARAGRPAIPMRPPVPPEPPGWRGLSDFKSFVEPERSGLSAGPSQGFTDFFKRDKGMPSRPIGEMTGMNTTGISGMSKAYNQSFTNKAAEAKANLKNEGDADPTLKEILAEIKNIAAANEE